MVPEDILFVFGSARGGTTFIGVFLQDWFQYSMGPEGSFVVTFHKKLPKYGELSDDNNFNRLLRDLSACDMLKIMRSKWPKPHRIDIDAGMLRQHSPENNYASAVYAVFDSIRHASGKQRLGIKYPDFWRHLDTLEEIFKERARYLWILRDGRDVALSNYHVSWGLRNAYACAQQWKNMTETVERFKQFIDPRRFVFLRYEDILSSPKTTIEVLTEQLDIKTDKNILRKATEKLLASPMRNNYDKWKKEMPASELRIYEAIAGDVLRKYGYQVINKNATVSKMESVHYTSAEFLRKVKLSIKKGVFKQ